MKRRSMKRVNVKNENKTFKTLAIATIAGLSIIGVGQAQAATLDEVDLSQKPIDTPTLDYLHNNDVQIKYEDGTEVAIPQSNYTMTEVKANEDGSKPYGDNIITQYDYDKTTGSLSPLYYEINYQTQFGNPDGDTTLTFGKITYKYNQGDTIDGSITNDGTSANIARDFVNTDSRDPLILNNENATINNITGNFIANSSSSSNRKLINNKGHIDNIKGTFAINKAYDGLIYNNENATIDKIEGLFVDNRDYGYAVSNSGIIKSILADFINGSGISNNYGVITNIVGSFINSDINNRKGINGGGTITNIVGDFIGSRIVNDAGTIDKIEGTFTNNSNSAINNRYDYSSSNQGLIKLILADFIANQGGGISNIYGGITDIIGSFIGNGGTENYGGAIYNDGLNTSGDNLKMTSYIGNITGTFLNNHVQYKGGAIYNTGKIDSITNSHFQNNYAESYYENTYGGAIYNNINWSWKCPKITNVGIGKIQNTSFIGNYAKSQSGKAQGGAIWSNRDLNIVADNGESLFSGNYVQNGDKKDPQAIFVTNSTTIEGGYYNGENDRYYYQAVPIKTAVTLNSINNGKIIFNDKITGETTKTIINKYYREYYSNKIHYFDDDFNETDTLTEVSVTPELKITGDSSSIVQLNNNIENLDISLSGTNLHLGARDNVLDGNNLDLQSGTLSMVNNQVGVASLNNVTLSGNTNFVADVDLANEQMDRITANTYGTHNGNLNIVGMNLLSDSTKDVTEIYFAEQGLKDKCC